MVSAARILGQAYLSDKRQVVGGSFGKLVARGRAGKGLGRALMDESIRRAWVKPISRYWVHTCTFDAPQALPFYIRSGFTPYARMVEIHDDPRLIGKLARDASPQVPLLG